MLLSEPKILTELKDLSDAFTKGDFDNLPARPQTAIIPLERRDELLAAFSFYPTYFPSSHDGLKFYGLNIFFGPTAEIVIGSYP